MLPSLRHHLSSTSRRSSSIAKTSLKCIHKRLPAQRSRVLAQLGPQLQLQPHRRYLNTGPLVNLFDSATDRGIQIRNVSAQGGIELEDGLTLRSSCVLIGGRVFLWKTPNTKPWTGWTKEDFEIFEVLVPKPELLLLGTGSSMLLPPPSIRQYLRDIGVQVDVMDTKNACSTYNLLSEEGRRVAAALLPLAPSTSWT